MSFKEFAQPWQNQKREEFRLPIPRNNRYFYKHHPNNWELKIFKKGKKSIPLWLPKLGVHPLTPGVNGCEMRGSGVDDTLVKARLTEAGWTVISNEKWNYVEVYKGIMGNIIRTNSPTLSNLVNVSNSIFIMRILICGNLN